MLSGKYFVARKHYRRGVGLPSPRRGERLRSPHRRGDAL